MAEVRVDEGLTPQGSAWIPGPALVQGVLGDGGRRIWPHEKPVSTWNVLARHQSTINRIQRSYMAWHVQVRVQA